MTQENKTQETVAVQAGALAPVLEPGELTATALALVTGGTEGPPGGAGDNNGRYVV
jgi:hypothetical protein